MTKNEIRQELEANGFSLTDAEFKKLTKAELLAKLETLHMEQEHTPTQGMAQALQKARGRYVKVKSASGKDSMDNGDLVAKLLRECTPAEVVASAEKLLGLDPGELAAKYAHLNPGQRRMNAGNRIRGALSRGDITEEECVKALA